MTKSIWDSITVYGTGMAELNNKTEVVEGAFARFQKQRNGTTIPGVGIVQFANGTGTYSFAAFLWPEGVLAKHKAQGYCITKGWNPSVGIYGWRVHVALSNGSELDVDPDDLEKADIPQDVMKLAVGQVKARCPLLNGGRE